MHECSVYNVCVYCEQVPGASQFFLNYVITAALGALALELSGVVKIVILAIKSMVRYSTQHHYRTVNVYCKRP
jgi:Calcium-dependent channel, 7TM region, putative phosphate